MNIGIIGSGAMGIGITQVVAQAGHDVILTDTRQEALDLAKSQLESLFEKLVEKGKMTADISWATRQKISYDLRFSAFKDCDLIVEAITENLEFKKKVFVDVEKMVGPQCILASNTSSLSITAIAAACKDPQRVMGIHFFNPAPLMPLVELVPGLQTDPALIAQVKDWIISWQKLAVVCRDTPGFIVNRIARPFYGEALRIYEEGVADLPNGVSGFQCIDQSMRDLGFRMGPFELMDLIGNDVNYAVTESVFTSSYFDQKYKPSIVQKRLNEAGWYGRKTGKGYYEYPAGFAELAKEDCKSVREKIGMRILTMLINEAFDAVHYQIASEADIDLAMTKGVNYPKGLIAWGNEIGLDKCVKMMDTLYDTYHEDRYRCSARLRELVKSGLSK